MFSDFERLSLINQFRILQNQNNQNDDWSNAITILSMGIESEYIEVTGMLDAPMPLSECAFVTDTLRMFEALQRRHSEDPATVPDDLAFPGFDGNSGSGHLAYWQFMRNEQNRWRYLRVRNENDLNSHAPLEDSYRRMLVAWHALGRPEATMTDEQAQQILTARIHPDARP